VRRRNLYDDQATANGLARATTTHYGMRVEDNILAPSADRN